MKFGLSEEDIQKMNTVFSRYPQIKEAIIYGSRAKGTYRNGSDVDLTLVGNGIDMALLFEIKNALDDLLLPYKIELSLFQDIKNEELISHIKRVGKAFYKSQ